MRLSLTIILLLQLLISCGPSLDFENTNTDRETSSNSDGVDPVEGILKIITFDVGEGDSSLIISPDNDALLIDTGPRGSWSTKVAPYLAANPEINLEKLIITHGDSDHNGDVDATGMTPLNVTAGNTLKLGESVKLFVVAKDCNFSDSTSVDCKADDDNALSTVILISFGNFKYLNMGDLPGGGGEPPYETIDLETKVADIVGDIDILKAGHHGSNTSTNQNLLSKTSPEVTIISVGNENKFWHPHSSTIERLLAAGIEVHQTERGWLKSEFEEIVKVANGDLTIEASQNGYEIK